MSEDPFQIVGESLTGHGLSFSLSSIGVPSDKTEAIVDMANVLYKQGRESALLSRDERYDMDNAVEALRALATIVGPIPTGDRYRRYADHLARMLQDQR